jgi:hypothetical protein
MHPENVMPFFPVEDALLPDFQVFGDLSEGDDEGFGVDAIAQRLPGHSYFTEYYVNYIAIYSVEYYYVNTFVELALSLLASYDWESSLLCNQR